MTITPLAWYDEGLPHIWPPYGQFPSDFAPLLVVSASGSLLTLADGRELVDGIASWWSMAHGYQHPHIIEAVQKQLHALSHVMFAGIAHEQAYTLANRLCAITPGGWEKGKALTRVFYSDSGSVAVEVALKIALQYWLNMGKPKKDRFICLHDGYHGDTLGAMSVSDPVNGLHKAFKNNVIKHFTIPIPNDEYGFEELKETLDAVAPQVAALIMEPLVQGAGGMKFHSADTLAEIHRLCREREILFIADEVATGFYRTGSRFACDEAGIVPDIMCLGKSLSGGVLPLAATLTREDIYAAFLGEGEGGQRERALAHGPTYMANPLACAAANASLDLFQREPCRQRVEAIESQLLSELSPLEGLAGVVDVRVKGALGVVQLDIARPELYAMRPQFVAEGVWLRPFGNIVYTAPPLTISSEELSQVTAAILNVVRRWSKEQTTR